ncbi:MAG TPA: choice-of-anchor D domain-containing protein [Terracidiphilus sp.]|nr:choice-of-anchor D domain-containing protein [Terracidiphilus sp.]
MAIPSDESTTPQWEPLGPLAVSTASYGLVSGRITSIAFDPSDSSGNTAYIGTTGGGVWLSQNTAASNAADVTFRPLTDNVGVLSSALDASISIGAVTVQPGGTGVVLAGTGDPNDALDSYYGAGILRSADNGASWSLIHTTSDALWSFTGEGIAGFAWSTVNPQLVVVAVSQAYGGSTENAVNPGASYEGLYYSTDAGATWALATITDGHGADVQGPNDQFVVPDGNAATAVVWNPVRRIFIAAVRYHGYYQSVDGVTWTRLATQPGTGLTVQACPTNSGTTGSIACPIFRGALAVNPVTGDTFAWTVDADNQDQGIWQDPCAINSGVCGNPTLAFTAQIATAPLESDEPLEGPATIENGDYNLVLAAMPSGQDTLLVAGANDLWKCSLAAGCTWRNTTNAATCMSAQVGEYQHALAWSSSNPDEILAGNDSGLWRSMDAIGETGSACSADDATHFQNLNSGLGSLAEVVDASQITTSPYTMMVGLGVNGIAGVKSTTGPTALWPQILGGEGGPVAIDPTNPAKWYANNGAGVSIHLCSQTSPCTAADFGSAPLVTDADVGGDGYTMFEPAPFLVDPLDPSQLLVGTCRVWRGPADGSTWDSSDAISSFLDGVTGNAFCNGDALIRSMAAAALPGGGEVIYVGMYGAQDGGATLAGHVLRAVYTPGSTPVWQDLTLNPVTNDSLGLNAYGMDISSIYIDPHDTTGNTVYLTVQGVHSKPEAVRTVYLSTDGGAHWADLSEGLPWLPANSIVVDPQDANTVYVATDGGVFITRQIATCAQAAASCWSAYGAGLPAAPVTQLRIAQGAVSPSVLVAGTYGRGIWQIPLVTAGAQITTATVDPASLSFGTEAYGTPSSPQTVTLANTGGIALAVSSISATGDFSETDNCQSAPITADASCTIQVTFTPTQAGSRTGQLTVNANVAGGALSVALSGTGGAPAPVSLLPAELDFGLVALNTTSSVLQVTVQNTQATAVSVSSAAASGPFTVASNACGGSIAANISCQLTVTFTPTQAGAAPGVLTVVDSAGTQTAALTGTGAHPPTDTLSPTSLAFSGTVVGQPSAAQAVTLANSGDLPLQSIAVSASGPFQASSTCGSQLAADANCAISVVFNPSGTGQQTGTLTVADAQRTQTIPLVGTGLQPPVLSVSPASLVFAAQPIGAASAPLTLTFSNTGGAPMSSLSFALSGLSVGSFSVASSTCNSTLNAGGSCTAQVVFTPSVAGGNVASLAATSPTPGVKGLTIALSGTGTAATGLNVTPAQLAFTVAALGQSSPAQTVTIANAGTTAATALAIVIAAPFSLTQNACGSTLAGGASCTVGIVFTPMVNGSVSGALSVTSGNLNSAVVALTGSGGAAGSVQLQPGSLAFPVTAVGAASTTQSITLTNTSTVPLTALALSVSNGFTLTGNSCTATLASGASCTASIAFVPSSVGAQTGALTVASSALPSSATASLSGTGFDFAVAASGPTSQSIASGQMADYTVSLTPLGGSGATFTYTCSNLPAHAACSFNPSSETIGANTSGSVSVQVSTGNATAAAHVPGLFPWRSGIALCGLVLLPLAWRRRHRLWVLCALLAIALGGAGGCVASGGGTEIGPGNSGSTTPPGTYTVQVTVSANGIAHGVSFSLTVD